ncbi:SAM-dependent methyltransferase [Nocardia sp. CA2R105]|uniref:SAM-dependent methyltransferase n=1 Tax=Nocardia coffeae TaxID=2873381 RepID=UPI001CA7731B|nr:SAM-dependent methyltransferase [Nocardia coffeae]MBY8863797.1 SAM-dependent methyltransferase [Nocardia coffeae]
MVDVTKPTIARVYDYSLGGKDNYEVDRAALAKVERIAPRHGELAQMNRRWLVRVVRFLAGSAGIDQFLDIGAGLPTAINTHQVAQQENSDARVIYVDNDPMCAVYGRALLEQNQNTHYLHGDILEAGTLLQNEQVTRHIDRDRPIGVLVCGLLQHLDDGLDPAQVMREYNTLLPDGSFMAVTNFWDPAEENHELHTLAEQLERAFLDGGLGSGWFRTREQQLQYFDGLELLTPGLTELEDWWPAGPATQPQAPEQRVVLGGVGYKRPPDPRRIHPR